MVNGLTVWLVDSCVAVLIALCWWLMLLCGGGEYSIGWLWYWDVLVYWGWGIRGYYVLVIKAL